VWLSPAAVLLVVYVPVCYIVFSSCYLYDSDSCIWLQLSTAVLQALSCALAWQPRSMSQLRAFQKRNKCAQQQYYRTSITILYQVVCIFIHCDMILRLSTDTCDNFLLAIVQSQIRICTPVVCACKYMNTLEVYLKCALHYDCILYHSRLRFLCASHSLLYLNVVCTQRSRRTSTHIVVLLQPYSSFSSQCYQAALTSAPRCTATSSVWYASSMSVYIGSSVRSGSAASVSPRDSIEPNTISKRSVSPAALHSTPCFALSAAACNRFGGKVPQYSKQQQ
jgi:hypothetical protein